ncbi:YciI family protein [Nakamurella sp.]|uniref:YciI family protein n=1 Tax=Nakamurella sp. TaxID=1869182 RepID=UPI0037852DD3
MKQYMLSVHHESPAEVTAISDEDMQRMYQQVDAFNEEVRKAGVWVFAGGLEGIESATVVDGRGGEAVITDGPFSETKEYLGGFWVIEAADLDEALEWARKGSAACEGRVEVRPFQGEA